MLLHTHLHTHTLREINYNCQRGSGPIPPTSFWLLKQLADTKADFLTLKLKGSKTGEGRTLDFLFLLNLVGAIAEKEGVLSYPTRFIKIWSSFGIVLVID